ncbi:hypothetical protein I6E06_03755 [Bifidobacterium boum]|uniref:hypothetical protein n=1 Tax=Bifidobacterium boum TaxID=78343 RepID=UPI001F22981E|nr:hypothetical protein [Bifidobacterium boum]MCF2561590.1 hypothetical protein [Bifidobacterium boum]
MDENHRTVISNTISTIIPQRLRHHKLHVALCLVTTILMIAVLAFFPAKTPVQWMACVIACCCPLGIALAPVPMSVISFAVVLLLIFTPGISLSDAGSIIHMLTPLAIGTLAYSTPTRWSIWSLVASIITLLLAFDFRHALPQGEALSLFVFLVLYIVTYASCASIRTIAIDDRQRHRDAELELLQTQQAHQQEVTRFAQMTHDAVTANLSSIFLLAQQHIDAIDAAGATNAINADDDATYGATDDAAGDAAANIAGNAAATSEQDWRTVRQLSESALASIRSVIRTMNSADEQPRNDQTDDSRDLPLPSRIGIAIEQGQHLLVPHHMHVDVHMSGQISSPSPICARSGDEAVTLVGEIFTNLLRHASPDSAPMLTITYDDDNMSLMQTNALTPQKTSKRGTERQSPGMPQTEATHDGTLPQSQSGLALHRDIIESLGGELRFNSEDGTWTLYARIPLHPAVQAE